MTRIRVVILIILTLIYKLEVYGAVEIDISVITNSRWRLEGYYNSGSCYSSNPLSPSVLFEQSVGKNIGVLINYQFIPLAINSPDCYKFILNNESYWLRQELKFNDNRLKIGVAVNLFTHPKAGSVCLRLFGGTSLNTLLKRDLKITVTPKVSVEDPPSQGTEPSLREGRRDSYNYGITYIFGCQVLWKKSFTRRLSFVSSLKYDYSDYEGTTVNGVSASNISYFKINFNQMMAIAFGINYIVNKR